MRQPENDAPTRGIAILGSTGSIGTQALEVVREQQDALHVEVLSAHRNADLLIAQAKEFKPNAVVIGDDAKWKQVNDALFDDGIKVYSGAEALEQVVEVDGIDMVLTAMVGAAGLKPTLRAIDAGKHIALANKETLVVAGELVMNAARNKGVDIHPVDSEHSAIYQCIAGEFHNPIEKVILTASGGPFRGRTLEELGHVTKADALKHPNWDMGAKITIDSASLMNKGLEVIEAKWLFDVNPDQIEVVVHPQSIVHSMIRYRDGSVLAQLGQPDMRTPIAYCLAWPERVDAGVEALDIVSAGRLDFEAPDLEAFPCLALAQWAITQPGGMCVFSAANEIAVAAFLSGEIRFTDIDRVIDAALKTTDLAEPDSLDAVQTLDQKAREAAQAFIASGLTRSES